jgi:hypothetical protein
LTSFLNFDGRIFSFFMESLETLKKATVLLFCSKTYVTERSSLPDTIESFVKNSFKSSSLQSKGDRGSSGFNLFKTSYSVKTGRFDYFFIILNCTVVFGGRDFFIFVVFYAFFKACRSLTMQYRSFFNWSCHLIRVYIFGKLFARKLYL